MGRRPRWVYGEGEEPDYRFSLANERTLLAWLRTSLALLAAGVALDTVDVDLDTALQRGLAVALVVAGLLCAAGSWWRWARSERAMRRRGALPGAGLGVVLTVAVVLIAAGLLIGLLIGLLLG